MPYCFVYLCSGVVFQQMQNLVRRLMWPFCSVVDLLSTVAPSVGGVFFFFFLAFGPCSTCSLKFGSYLAIKGIGMCGSRGLDRVSGPPPPPPPPEKSQNICFLALQVRIPRKITATKPAFNSMLGHHRPISETPFNGFSLACR